MVNSFATGRAELLLIVLCKICAKTLIFSHCLISHVRNSHVDLEDWSSQIFCIFSPHQQSRNVFTTQVIRPLLITVMWNYGNPQKPISFGFSCTNSAGRFRTLVFDLQVANQLMEHVATFVTRSSLVSISIWKHLTWLIKQWLGIKVLLQWKQNYGNPQKPISFSFSCTNRR